MTRSEATIHQAGLTTPEGSTPRCTSRIPGAHCAVVYVLRESVVTLVFHICARIVLVARLPTWSVGSSYSLTLVHQGYHKRL